MDMWVITLAFPFHERLNRSGNKMGAGIYAFLPTEMVTGFPFVIQADFLLVTSTESIIFYSKWNQGILNCIPSAFCSAFSSLLRSVESLRFCYSLTYKGDTTPQPSKAQRSRLYTVYTQQMDTM